MSTQTATIDCSTSGGISQGPVVHAKSQIEFLQREAGMTGKDVTGTLNRKTLETLNRAFGDLGQPNFETMSPDVVEKANEVMDIVGRGAFKLKHDEKRGVDCKEGTKLKVQFNPGSAGQPTIPAPAVQRAEPQTRSLSEDFKAPAKPTLSEGALTGGKPAPGFFEDLKKSYCPTFICG